MKSRKKNKGLRDMGIAFAIVLSIPVLAFISVMTVFVVWAPADDDSLSTRCSDATPVEELGAADAGRVIVVKGEVAGTRKVDRGISLDLGGRHPDQDLAVVIARENVDNWTMPPDQQYDGQEVATAGVLGLAGESLQVEVRSPDDIAVCP